jgi:uncharacterized oxidoreductase
MPLIASSKAHKLTQDIFIACGAPADDARIVADHLVGANLRGVDSHGLIRIPQYVRDVREGTICPAAKITILHETPLSAVVDCGWNFGVVGGEKAAAVGLQKAGTHKVALVVTRSCNHAGRIGHYMEGIANAGFLGLGFCSSSKQGHFVVPWGGRDGRLATNPIAYGVPILGRPPVIADFSTSKMPEGKIRLYRNRKQALPEGCILDATGEPSTSPSDFYGPPLGTILPFGGEQGYRGYALSLLVEVMGTILAGYDSREDRDRPPSNGLTFLIFDPALVVQPEVYNHNVAALTDYVKSSRAATGFAEVQLPGEPEQLTRAKRSREGIEIEAATWTEIVNIAATLNVKLDANLEPTPVSKKTMGKRAK